MTTILTGAALATVALLAVVLWVTRSRLRALEARTAHLEDHLRADVEPEVAAARAEARDATVAARRASLASGVDEPPPRLPFEPVTGRVVRAVAFGAGARRALARAAAPTWSRRGVRRSA
jgi:hypothetical protein